MDYSPPANTLLLPFCLSRVCMKWRIETLGVNDSHLYGSNDWSTDLIYISFLPQSKQTNKKSETKALFFFIFLFFQAYQRSKPSIWANLGQSRWSALKFSHVICGFIASLLFVLVASQAGIFCTESVIIFTMPFFGFSSKSVSIAPISASFHSSSVKTEIYSDNCNKFSLKRKRHLLKTKIHLNNTKKQPSLQQPNFIPVKYLTIKLQLYQFLSNIFITYQNYEFFDFHRFFLNKNKKCFPPLSSDL